MIKTIFAISILVSASMAIHVPRFQSSHMASHSIARNVGKISPNEYSAVLSNKIPETGEKYTVYLKVDDEVDLYHNGKFIGHTTLGVKKSFEILAHAADVLSFRAVDTRVILYGLYFVAIPANPSLPTFSSGYSHAKGINSKNYQGGDEWMLPSFDACSWPSIGEGTYKTTESPFGENSAQSLWARDAGQLDTVLVRMSFGGDCSPCSCDTGNGCHSGVCSNCLFTFIDPAGEKTKACYEGWSIDQCLMYGPEYTWCGN